MKENQNEGLEEKEILYEIRNTNELQDKQKDSIYSFKDDINSEKISNLIIEKEKDQNENKEISNNMNNNNNANSNSDVDEDDEEEENEINKISFTKDYVVLFVLFISSSFNFSFLYLPFIFETIIYLIYLESISDFGIKIKYFLQIFNFIFSTILLVIKIIFLSYKNGKSSVVQNNKDLFLNLGLCYLHDMDSSYYFTMSFFTEIIILLVNLFTIISKKFLGSPKNYHNHNIFFKTERNWKLRTLIFLAYISILGHSIYNISFLTLFYILLIQIIFFINSLNFDNKNIKMLFKLSVYFMIILLYLQIILINILNIPKYQNKIQILDEKGDIKYYSKWTKIGFRVYNPSKINIFEERVGYFFVVLSFIVLVYISNVLSDNNSNDGKYHAINQDEFINTIKPISNTNNNIKNKENEDIHYKRKITDIINKKNIEKGVKKIKTFNEKIFYYFTQLSNNPLLMFQISRIISIYWIYIYRNFLSINVFIYLFFSFLYVNDKCNKYLSIMLLTPTLIISLAAYHLSNIDGYFENSEKFGDIEKVKYLHFALGKLKYPKLEFLLGHLYFINTMFLVFGLIYKESKNKNKNSIKENILNPQKKQLLVSGESQIQEPLISGTTSSISVSHIFGNKRTSSINDEDDKNDDNDNDLIKASTNNLISETDENFENIYEDNEPKKKGSSKIFFRFLLKTLFSHLDKITLILMYFVSVYTINLVHIVLVLIFMIQIISPSKINEIFSLLLVILQLLFLFEFMVDLLKVYYLDTFNEETMNLLLIYDKDLFSNKIEVYLYALVYSFHLQYKSYNYEYLKTLLNDNELSLESIITNKFQNSPKLKKIFFLIGSIILKVYFWLLVVFFIFVSSYFEINILFGIKLILFFMICYQFLTTIQQPKERKCFSKLINFIFLLYCCLNTFAVYLFQLDAGILEEIKDKKGFFYQNLPTFGLTKYKKNLYYHFLPHFMSTFIAVLFYWEIERVYNIINRKIQNEKFGIINDEEKVIADEDENDNDTQLDNDLIKDEFDIDKYYSNKYNINYKKIKRKSSQLIKIHLGLIFTKLYWLLLFFSIGIIFGSYDLSLSMVIYIIIFSIILISSFHHILIKLKHYLSKKSYYISKVIRYKLVEKPRHIEKNKYYRIKAFRNLLGFSLLFFILLYFYSIFELFQYGCNDKFFKGCDGNHHSIVTPGSKSENYIKSIAFIFGIYINIQEEGILTVAWIHLFLSGLICFAIYIHKLEDKLTNLSVVIRDDLRKILNENNILEKYADINDLNILIKIGLTVAGIEIPNRKENLGNEENEKEKNKNILKRGYSYQLNYFNNPKKKKK